jgi:hypothetical protein
MSSSQFVIEIRSWDWPLHVGVRPRSAAAERDPDGDLMCVETITIEGLVLAPEEHRSEQIHLRLTPLPREVIFGDREQRDVGRLHRAPVQRKDLAFSANLFLPEDTMQNAIFCLGSIWRRIHLWVEDGDEPMSVIEFGFSRRPIEP